MKILLTGFDQFGGAHTNPSYEAVKAVTAPDGIELIKMKVPTVFGKSLELVHHTVREVMPDAVLMTGQSGGRSMITLERIAVNLEDAAIPDNDGNQPTDSPIFTDAPAAFFSTLPVRQIVAAIREAGVPADISESAGTFVCNQLMYGILYYAETEFPDTRCGFMRVPYTPEQIASIPHSAARIARIAPISDIPSMSVADIVRAMEAALTAIRDTNEK